MFEGSNPSPCEREILPKTERKPLIYKGWLLTRAAVYFYSEITRKPLITKGKLSSCAASQALMPYRVIISLQTPDKGADTLRGLDAIIRRRDQGQAQAPG